MVAPDDVVELTRRGLLQPRDGGVYRRSDIQRIRTVSAIRASGIDLEQLAHAVDARLVSLQPMDLLYPEPAVVTTQTFGALADSLGMSSTELTRVAITAGFPAPNEDELLRDDDSLLIRRLVEIGRALGGGEIVERTARIFGEAARHAAEGSLRLFDEGINQPMTRDPAHVHDEDAMHDLNARAGRLMVDAEELIAALFRRHLEHAILGSWAESAELVLDQLGVRPASPRQPAIAFVDLAGYTGLTEREGDTIAVSLSSQLARLAEMAAAARGGRVVKLLGDGAMLHFRDVGDGVRAALDLVRDVSQSALPAAHAGVNAGPLIERDGDYFGRTVNLAARIAGHAAAGEVLVSGAVASAAQPDLRFEAAGDVTFKGAGTVSLFRARWT